MWNPARAYVLLCVFLLLALAACAAAPTPPAPTPTAKAEQTSEPAPLRPTQLPPAPVVDDWARIQAAKTFLVASSLDNPPFDMYDPQFKPSGFDIALMTELGKRLGVSARFKDFTFDGLLGALQTNQADAVISSMAITKDRQALADFTRNYYRGDDGILAAPNSPITEITTVADVANRRVGVVRGTVYEAFLLKNLVETGKMPAANLQSYLQWSDAMSDLQAGKVDLVIMDRLPAQTYVNSGAAKMVGHSTYTQDYGIAVRRGSTLLPELNRALAEVQADGTLARLAEQYLQVKPEPLPTDTPAPAVLPTMTPAAIPTPAPVDGMAYVADLTLDDHNMTQIPVLQPGQPFQKGWRIKNTGTTTWTPDYRLEYASGNTPISQMGGQPVLIGRPVAPGTTDDVYVNLVAPGSPGTYQGFWQMKNASGTAFGEKIYAAVTVPGPPTPLPPPTPVPPPTQPPSPGISFTVDQTQINAGQCVNFSWNVTGVNAVFFCPGGTNCQGVAGQGGQQACPTSTTMYQLNVQMNDGSTQSRQITINVNPSPNQPTITTFASDHSSVQSGQCLNLWWNVQGSASRIALVRSGTPLWDYAPANASKTDCPTGNGLVTYELQAWGPGGSGPIKAQVPVQINGAPPPTNPPPCQPRTLNVSDGNCGQTQNMQLCDTLVVTLHANAGTGYSWTAQDYGDPMLAFQGGGNAQCGNTPGAQCQYRWQYHGQNRGSITLLYALRGPTGGDSKQCNFPVTVK
jgi:ABC-type amino acid transport substrate-binding protein